MLIFEAKPSTMIRKIPRLPLARTDETLPPRSFASFHERLSV